LKYFKNNVAGTITLTDTMLRYGVRNLIFSSSATVYGDSPALPLTESSAVNVPQNPYGRSKAIVETMLQDLSDSDATWRIVCLRYFNPVGAHPSGLIGEDPRNTPNNLMPLITQAALKKREEITIFGSDYPTPDGTAIRDYIHVVDLAKGHVAALKKLLNFSGIMKVNLGTGKGHSVMQVIEAFEEVTGTNVPFKMGARRQGDVPECFADVQFAESCLGWRAEFGIKEMCLDSWNWQVKNPNGFQNG
jgi:UDP-glucose 4-epimerase